MQLRRGMGFGRTIYRNGGVKHAMAGWFYLRAMTTPLVLRHS
jgi:hypothetical protein